MDRFTETSYTNYGQNLLGSLKGILIGILFVIGSIMLLWWNEGRSVAQAEALGEMQKNILTLPDTKYDSKYEGKAVLLQGEVKPLQELGDALFGVHSNGLKLRRDVQMYQWREKKSSKSEDKLGGGTETVTTYEYTKEWSSSFVDSKFFKHQEGHYNPPMAYGSETFTADAQMGDYHLTKELVGHIGASQTYQGLSSLPKKMGKVTNYNGFLYMGKDPYKPKVGDMKIIYYDAPAGVYTFAAKVQGRALVPYVTENEKSFVFVRSGKVDAVTIFKQEKEANKMLTWVFRIVGLVVMFFGFSMMMGILPTLAKVIPFLGSLVGGVTGIIAGVLTLVLGSLVIALAWFSSRPVLSLIIIIMGFGVATVIGKYGKRREVPSEKDTITSK